MRKITLLITSLLCAVLLLAIVPAARAEQPPTVSLTWNNGNYSAVIDENTIEMFPTGSGRDAQLSLNLNVSAEGDYPVGALEITVPFIVRYVDGSGFPTWRLPSNIASRAANTTDEAPFYYTVSNANRTLTIRNGRALSGSIALNAAINQVFQGMMVADDSYTSTITPTVSVSGTQTALPELKFIMHNTAEFLGMSGVNANSRVPEFQCTPWGENVGSDQTWKYETWQSAWGAAPSDAADYFYVSWAIAGRFNNNLSAGIYITGADLGDGTLVAVKPTGETAFSAPVAGQEVPVAVTNRGSYPEYVQSVASYVVKYPRAAYDDGDRVSITVHGAFRRGDGVSDTGSTTISFEYVAPTPFSKGGKSLIVVSKLPHKDLVQANGYVEFPFQLRLDEFVTGRVVDTANKDTFTFLEEGKNLRLQANLRSDSPQDPYTLIPGVDWEISKLSFNNNALRGFSDENALVPIDWQDTPPATAQAKVDGSWITVGSFHRTGKREVEFRAQNGATYTAQYLNYVDVPLPANVEAVRIVTETTANRWIHEWYVVIKLKGSQAVLDYINSHDAVYIYNEATVQANRNDGSTDSITLGMVKAEMLNGISYYAKAEVFINEYSVHTEEHNQLSRMNLEVRSTLRLNSASYFNDLSAYPHYNLNNAKVYTLLPEHMTLDPLSNIGVGNTGFHTPNQPNVSVNVQRVPNWKGSGREMVIMTPQGQSSEPFSLNNVAFNLPVIYDWSSASTQFIPIPVSTAVYLDAPFEGKTDSTSNTICADAADNAKASEARPAEKPYYHDLNGDGNPASEGLRTVYDIYDFTLTVTPYSFAGGVKKVMGLAEVYDAAAETFPGRDYSYRWQYMGTPSDGADSVVLYDVLEEGADVNARGTFRDIAVGSAQGVTHTVYYSTNTALRNRLSTTDAMQDVTNTTYWSTVRPADPSAIVAIAVRYEGLDQADSYNLITTLEMTASAAATGKTVKNGMYFRKAGGGMTSVQETALTVRMPNISISKTSDPSGGTSQSTATPVKKGPNLTYLVTVTNSDVVALDNVQVTDYYNKDFTSRDLSGITWYRNGNSGSSLPLGGVVTAAATTDGETNFTISQLPAGESITLVIPLEVTADTGRFGANSEITHVDGVADAALMDRQNDSRRISNTVWHRLFVTPSIKVAVGTVPTSRHRNIQYFVGPSNGQNISFISDDYRVNVLLYLLDENKEQIGDPIEYDRSDMKITFPGDGTYYIRVGTSEEYDAKYVLATKILNGPNNYVSGIQGDFVSEPIQVQGETVTASATTLRWFMERRSFGFETRTNIGQFSNDAQSKQYFPLLPDTTPRGETIHSDEFRRNGYFKNINDWLYTRSGIYYAESANLYANMNSLEVPTWTDPQYDGYTFLGWHLEGTPADKILSEADALSLLVTKDIVLDAVFAPPTHKITFITDPAKGTINGAAQEEYSVEGNVSSLQSIVATVPVPDAQDGYAFEGWYSDIVTANVIPNDEIQNKVITESITYYAKYSPLYTVTYVNSLTGDVLKTQAGLKYGDPTPAAPSVPQNDDYVFLGWNPAVQPTVTDNIVYYTTWKPAATYTVTYADGVGGSVFADDVHTGLALNADTPACRVDPARDGYTFGGWTPTVADKVTRDVVYFAVWKPVVTPSTFTVIYTDDVGRVAFPDQVYTNLAFGEDTPAFEGTPTRDGYVFVEWNPKVSSKVTGDAVYFAAWAPKPTTPSTKAHTVVFLSGPEGALQGRGTHVVPDGQSVPLVPPVEAKDGYTFLEKWKVVEVVGDTDFVQVGDVLNETNISRLAITYDITFQALYETPTATPTAEPTATPTAGPTAKPTATPMPAPTRVPNNFYFSFTKEWHGEPTQDIKFTLYHPNGTAKPHQFKQTKVSETKWLYEAWLSTDADYYVVEEVIPGYTAVYKNIGEHAGETGRAYNGGTIINTSVPKTGDDSDLVLWVAIAAVSVVSLAAVPLVRKKKGYK